MMMPRERERNLDIHPSHPSWTDETETKSIERKRVDGDQMIPAPPIHPHVPCVGRMCVHFTPRGRAKKKNKIKKRTETMCCRPWSVRPSIHRQHPDTPAHHQSANGHFSLPCFPEKEIERRRRRERYRYCCWKRYPVPPPPPPYLPPSLSHWVPPFLSHTGTQDDPAKWHPSTFSSSSFCSSSVRLTHSAAAAALYIRVLCSLVYVCMSCRMIIIISVPALFSACNPIISSFLPPLCLLLPFIIYKYPKGFSVCSFSGPMRRPKTYIPTTFQ